MSISVTITGSVGVTINGINVNHKEDKEDKDSSELTSNDNNECIIYRKSNHLCGCKSIGIEYLTIYMYRYTMIKSSSFMVISKSKLIPNFMPNGSSLYHTSHSCIKYSIYDKLMETLQRYKQDIMPDECFKINLNDGDLCDIIIALNDINNTLDKYSMK